MPQAICREIQAFHSGRSWSWSPLLFILLISVLICPRAEALSEKHFESLRQDTAHLFYHGFDGYMKHAFPDDELRPISCGAFTRDFENQNHWELNDPLPDYSLTLIDSLSTLAILASSSSSPRERSKALSAFKDGVQSLIKLYGDGTDGPSGTGERARGFDIDSKVQVFETVIRGLGGLLSAHLFATCQLPITGYCPPNIKNETRGLLSEIKWSQKFTYKDQLLKLAHDLGKRLLPAFSTQTGIPYPRVNLRHGIPFYRNAPQNCEAEPPEDEFGDNLQCPAVPLDSDERTETCSAGAGSLVLEFTVLSRLTGDSRFETFAKRAFWSVWDRRLPTGLVGAGIDAETGEWKGSPVTGIGAGIDSFYEYAIKSYILLSGTQVSPIDLNATRFDTLFEPPPLSVFQDSAEGFLAAWEASQRAIKRHVYREDNAIHPHYTQVNLYNAAQAAPWVDSLSAFYPGVLALGGFVEEAAATHLLYAALWARYSAIPERWSTVTGDIEHGLPWWPGRPEFIESTFYLYQATQDPWYVYVGEMALRDMKHKCWAPCGWAGIQDVRTGELNDRMESFFLGETAKYLHLLFDPNHPLNKFDAPWVFSTEGHPLIVPRSSGKQPLSGRQKLPSNGASYFRSKTCPKASEPYQFTISNMAARRDLFHAAALARLHLANPADHRSSASHSKLANQSEIFGDDLLSPNNDSFYPWTLPLGLIPPSGICDPIPETPTLQITFPTPSTLALNSPNHRTMKGVFMNNLAGVRLSIIQDSWESDGSEIFRVNAINNQAIGRDEQVYVSQAAMSNTVMDTDPNFTRFRDPALLEVVFDVPKIGGLHQVASAAELMKNASAMDLIHEIVYEVTEKAAQNSGSIDPEQQGALADALAQQGFSTDGALASALRFLAEKFSSKVAPIPALHSDPAFARTYLDSVSATGPGSAPLPAVQDAPSQNANGGQPQDGKLLWSKVHATDELCGETLSANIVRGHQVLVVKRGGCSFSDKLERIPSVVPGPESLKLVIFVDFPESAEPGFGSSQVFHPTEREGWPLGGNGGGNSALPHRPLLERQQKTPSGLLRRHPISAVMVGGGERVYNALSRATAFGIKRRYSVQAQGRPITNVHIV